MTHTTDPLQENEDTNSIHDYDYIPPLPVVPVVLNSSQHQPTGVEEENDEMIDASSNQRLHSNSEQQRDATSSYLTPVFCPPPLPPPNIPREESTGEIAVDEKDVGDIAMVHNEAHDSVQSPVEGSSDVVVMYI